MTSPNSTPGPKPPSLREVVARAIRQEFCDQCCGAPQWDELTEVQQEDLCRMADAAIVAIQARGRTNDT